MANVSGSVPTPYEGVSQADPTVRLQGACAAMEDCITLIPGGAQPRPPLELVRTPLVRSSDGAAITADPYALFQDVDRGDPSLDLAIVLNREGSTVQPYLFFTSTWDPCPFDATTAALAYLAYSGTDSKPTQDFRVVTIEDTTFITHRKRPVVATTDTAPARPFEALIWVKTGAFARRTVVSVTSTAIPGTHTASFSTASGANSADILATGTDRLAKALYDGTDPSPTHDTPNPNPLTALTAFGFTVILDGSLIYLSHPTVDFSLVVTDDAGGTAVTAIKGAVQRFSDLPEVAHANFTVKIAQEAAGANNNYYVKFVPAGASTKGYWQEVVAPGSPLGIDPASMPLRLYLDGGGMYHLDVGPWSQRTVGDPTLAPDPPFLTDPIVDINWWRGRLGLVSPAAYTLSASNNPFVFYPTTLAAALDSDPIVELPPSKGRNRFRQVVTFDERLVILGNGGQAIVGAGDTVAPDVTYIKPLAGASFDDLVPAQAASSKVYFAASRRSYKAILELATNEVSGQQIPADISGAIPKYITALTDRAATLETEYITVYGTSGDRRLVVHTFKHDDKAQRVQNAWNAWNLPTGYACAGYFFKDHRLYVMMTTAGGTFTVAAMDVSPDQTDDGGSILTYADLRFDESQTSAVYDALVDETTFTFTGGLVAQTGLQAFVRTTAGFGDSPEGYALQITNLTPTLVTVKGDYRTAPLWFGYTFNAYFDPSKFYVRGSDGNTKTGGRLTISHIDIKVAEGSYLYVQVDQRGRASKEPFRAIVGGDPSAMPLAADPVTIKDVPIASRNEDLHIRMGSDSHLGFKVFGLEWRGTYTGRSTSTT